MYCTQISFWFCDRLYAARICEFWLPTVSAWQLQTLRKASHGYMLCVGNRHLLQHPKASRSDIQKPPPVKAKLPRVICATEQRGCPANPDRQVSAALQLISFCTA